MPPILGIYLVRHGPISQVTDEKNPADGQHVG